LHKSKLLKQLQSANTAIKLKTTKAHSKLSNLENDIISLKKNLTKENHTKLEQMKAIVDQLRLEKKSQLLKMPTAFKNLKLMAYELIDGIVKTRRLATFHNSGKKKIKNLKKKSNSTHRPIDSPRCDL
jgi:hypothetical protein